jgi:starvation-inducible outer membrane lipoprotein
MWYRFLTIWVVILLLVAMGCSSSPVGIPEALEPQIDNNLTFKEVLTSPESYKGRLILLGGEILKAKRLKKWTQIELLQLPLTRLYSGSSLLVMETAHPVLFPRGHEVPIRLTETMFH